MAVDALTHAVLNHLGTGSTTDQAHSIIALVRAQTGDPDLTAQRDAALALADQRLAELQAAQRAVDVSGSANLDLSTAITDAYVAAGLDAMPADETDAIRHLGGTVSALKAHMEVERRRSMTVDAAAQERIQEVQEELVRRSAPPRAGGPGEVAEVCGVSPQTARNWARDRANNGYPDPVGQCGKSELVDLDAVAAWHQAQEQ